MTRAFGLSMFGFTTVLSTGTMANEFGTSLPLQEGGAETYYVEATCGAAAPADFLVDTGSGYLVINAATLAALKAEGQARYLRDVFGTMADGSKEQVPIYRVASLQVGCCCVVENVEAAVFSNTPRQILGLSALKKLAPFAVSFDPPRLMLSQCIRQAGGADGFVSGDVRHHSGTQQEAAPR